MIFPHYSRDSKKQCSSVYEDNQFDSNGDFKIGDVVENSGDDCTTHSETDEDHDLNCFLEKGMIKSRQKLYFDLYFHCIDFINLRSHRRRVRVHV